METASLISPAPPAAPAAPASQPAVASPASPAPPGTPAAPAAPQPSTAITAVTTPSIPEKFVVKRTDGTVDHEATLQKALGAYTSLETRIGTGDVRPDTETGYKLDYAAFPEGIKINPEGEKSFLKRMHGSGMTNKQVQAVLNEYGAILKQGQELQATQATEQATAILKEVNAELTTAWGENSQANIQAAIRGFNALADEADKKDLALIGKDSRVTYRLFMKFLAKAGAGLQEDTAVNGGSVNAATLNQLKNSEAYMNAEHKDHAATVAQVTAMYQQLYPQKQ